jgi:hypothetical protein
MRSVPEIILLLILGSSLIEMSGADDLYLEGFLNKEKLPGSPNDPRSMPNLPFSTDTNRISDGVTSTDPYSQFSTNFPLYSGALTNGDNRYLFYLAYAQSAAEQGIALYGAGDAIIEDARESIIQQVNYTSLPNPTKNFTVYASVKWNPSGFAIQTGEMYSIEVEGSQGGYSSQFWTDGNIRANAEGYVAYFDAVSNCHVALGRCRSHLKKKRRYLSANWMSLICSIGQFVRPLGAVHKGNEAQTKWLPLDESRLLDTFFYVGQQTTFRAPNSGELICFANDAHNLYWNNAGSLNVTVTRLSWPPDNSTYYQDLYMPSCDSAIAVYANQGVNVENTTLQCNPNGGGTGWTDEEYSGFVNDKYESGAPPYLSYVPKGIVL